MVKQSISTDILISYFTSIEKGISPLPRLSFGKWDLALLPASTNKNIDYVSNSFDFFKMKRCQENYGFGVEDIQSLLVFSFSLFKNKLGPGSNLSWARK
jgi:hypothetical protein